MATTRDVRKIAMSLPGVEERPQHGRPSWRTKTRWFAVLREDGSVVLWVETKDERDALIRAEHVGAIHQPLDRIELIRDLIVPQIIDVLKCPDFSH